MLAQLCRAKPWTLSNKSSARQSNYTSGQPNSSSEVEAPSFPDATSTDADSRCQLRYCSFCDYRVCCLVSPCVRYDWEAENLSLQPTVSCSQSTENPAYGLSAKNWLEIPDNRCDNDQSQMNVVHQMEQTENEKYEPVTDKRINSSSTNRLHQANSGASQEAQIIQEIADVQHNSNINAQLRNQENSLEKIEEACHKVIDPQTDSTQLQITSGSPFGFPSENMCDIKANGRIWSVLRHKENRNSAFKNCDTKCDDNVITSPKISDKICDSILPECEKSNANIDTKYKTKNTAQCKPLYKKHVQSSEVKQLSFIHNPLLSKPANELVRRKKLPSSIKEIYPFNNSRTPHVTKKNLDPTKIASDERRGRSSSSRLSEITTVKTEESIQEWLQRISEWVDNNSWIRDSCDEQDDDEEVSNDATKCQQHEQNSQRNVKNETSVNTNSQNSCIQTENILSEDKICHSVDDKTHSKTQDNVPNEDPTYECSKNHEVLNNGLITNVYEVLNNASKESPANIPMVVMQCSRLHSHITNTPPFQQTSLPMGTLVTALYQESDWLYVQTPHGIEGFVCSSNCHPIGTINEPSQSTKRPWEPCDFPIQISIRGTCDFRTQQGLFVPAKLPTNSGKQAGPYVNTVKMKTNFYNDGYFNNTFKPKDSIKTAKTVTDILRSSPDTKITNH